jgi:putative flippase GtrA
MVDDIATSPEAATAPGVSTLGSEGVHEFIRYFAASLAALAVDVGLLWFLTSVATLPYLLSGAIAFTIGLSVVYVLSVFWVFEARTVRNPVAEFAIFALIGLIGLGFNEAILYLFTAVFGVYYLISKIASVVVVFSWNFAARKWLLFRSGT